MHSNEIGGSRFYLDFMAEALNEPEFAHLVWTRVSDNQIHIEWSDEYDDPTKALAERTALLYHNEVGSPEDYRFDERG